MPFKDAFNESLLSRQHLPSVHANFQPSKQAWNAWDDWKAYNLDATWSIPQGSAERVRNGNIGFLKTSTVRPGEEH